MYLEKFDDSLSELQMWISTFYKKFDEKLINTK